MAIGNWPRMLAVSVPVSALAIVLGAQALSGVSTRTNPPLALSLMPSNGMARERVAFETFSSAVADEAQDVEGAARAAAEIALAAVRSDPLTPKSQAILAMAQTDEAERREILEAATRLNRRDQTLQGLLLQQYIAAKDYPRTVETLDQILRVHPEYSRELFPLLASALAQSEAIPLFAEMLDGSSSWHERFLVFAVGQRDVLANLALLRQQITIANEDLDRRLISGLADSGDIEGARALLRRVGGIVDAPNDQGVLDWRSSYPPFEWRFVDKPGFRAQQSPDGQELELSLRPGQGGVVAARLLEAPRAPFEIRIDHRIAPADQLKDIRLQLVCAGTSTPILDERFSRQGAGFRIESLPTGCDYLAIAINARAWSGRSALSGSIERITIARIES